MIGYFQNQPFLDKVRPILRALTEYVQSSGWCSSVGVLVLVLEWVSDVVPAVSIVSIFRFFNSSKFFASCTDPIHNLSLIISPASHFRDAYFTQVLNLSVMSIVSLDLSLRSEISLKLFYNHENSESERQREEVERDLFFEQKIFIFLIGIFLLILYIAFVFF